MLHATFFGMPRNGQTMLGKVINDPTQHSLNADRRTERSLDVCLLRKEKALETIASHPDLVDLVVLQLVGDATQVGTPAVLTKLIKQCFARNLNFAPIFQKIEDAAAPIGTSDIR